MLEVFSPGRRPISRRRRRAAAWPRGRSVGRPRLLATDGVTFIEAVVGAALIALLIGGVLLVYGAATQVQARGWMRYRLEDTARAAVNRIVRGDPDGSAPLLLASAVSATASPVPALAYHVVWQDKSGSTHDDEVTCYFQGGRLYRVVNPYSPPLGFQTSGGTVIAEGVTAFTVTLVERYVQISLTIGLPTGTSYTLTTGVTPRGLLLNPSGG